jgi:hypothetical protein
VQIIILQRFVKKRSASLVRITARPSAATACSAGLCASASPRPGVLKHTVGSIWIAAGSGPRLQMLMLIKGSPWLPFGMSSSSRGRTRSIPAALALYNTGAWAQLSRYFLTVMRLKPNSPATCRILCSFDHNFLSYDVLLIHLQHPVLSASVLNECCRTEPAAVNRCAQSHQSRHAADARCRPDSSPQRCFPLNSNQHLSRIVVFAIAKPFSQASRANHTLSSRSVLVPEITNSSLRLMDKTICDEKQRLSIEPQDTR